MSHSTVAAATIAITPPIDVTQHAGLVHTIARRYAGAVRGKGGLGYDDVVQSGFIGAMRAAESYDPALASPSTYMGIWIRQAVQREIANRAETVRVSVAAQAKRRKRGELARATVHSLDSPIGGDSEGHTYVEMLAAPDPEEATDLPSLETLIARTPTLTERERRVMSLRATGVSLKQIGAELGLSRERVRQIEARAMLRIREQLFADGELERVEVPRYVATQRLQAERARQRKHQRAVRARRRAA